MSVLANLVLPYVIPVVVAALSPVATEYTKKAVTFLKAKLPPSVVATLAAAVAEGANQLQSVLSGVSLPPGASAIIAVIVNEALSDLGVQPNLTAK